MFSGRPSVEYYHVLVHAYVQMYEVVDKCAMLVEVRRLSLSGGGVVFVFVVRAAMYYCR